MNLSPYFHDQLDSYQAEIDDLTSDSEGKDVLQRRLTDKRSGFAAIVGLLDTDPLLLAPAFHGAFSFPENRAEAIEDLLTRVPGDFRPWAEIAGQVRIASWAKPMVALRNTRSIPSGARKKRAVRLVTCTLRCAAWSRSWL
jgi:hypothetical protein